MNDVGEEHAKAWRCALAFEKRGWSYAQTLSWVKWRHIDKILEKVIKGESWYNGGTNTRKVVSDALKDGLLNAIKDDGSVIPASFWHGFKKENWNFDGLCFSRANILQLWPIVENTIQKDLELIVENVDEEKKPKKRRRGPTTRLLAEKLIREAYPGGLPPGVGGTRVGHKINTGLKGHPAIGLSTINRALKEIRSS